MLWGQASGKDVHLVTLKSDTLEVDICSLGATLVAVRVNVKGIWLDVILGYESLEGYTNGGKPNFASVVGRCANRVANGAFELDGQVYELERNNGPHHLHGGTEGFYKQVFDVEGQSETEVSLAFTEADGTMGYPGTVKVIVTYEVRCNELHFRYSGTTDKPTLLSMTNHAYWNLKGHEAGDVLDHKLMVAGSRTTATASDGTLAITGELLPVKDTGLDLQGIPRLLQDAVDKAGPIDCNYCLDAPEGGIGDGQLAACLTGPNGLSMEVWTDQPGLQVFTGQNIASAGLDTWWRGKGGIAWRRFGAICLEPQLWPDGAHQSHFASPVLRPGQTYRHHSWHVFSVSDGAPPASKVARRKE